MHLHTNINMKTGNFVSIKSIADKLLMNPIMKDLNFEFIVDKAVECLRLVNACAVYKQKLEKIEVRNFKGELPGDIMRISQLYYSKEGDLVPVGLGTDIVHSNYDLVDRKNTENNYLTYSISTSKITTNIENVDLLIAYDSLILDEECYPMIPDNVKLIRAIESYIKYKWFDILNDMDKVSDRKLNKAEVDYCFNVAQAQNDLVMPSIDEMEVFANNIRQIVPNTRQYDERMKFLGSKEFIKVH